MRLFIGKVERAPRRGVHHWSALLGTNSSNNDM
jgi:hypothetical protein